ncbi:MAG: PadR family transcriptional regulator [Tildeniella nuda ZEHNDER 1965/U140]|jgi:DNA-binding PadR family transcriptional regulator|nr:PadR family transcriptional regulator [Tildeniella nuda ZEHNDER 1965/U140]
MLELAALGLLQREHLHGYRLKQQLELLMSSCISVNYGTIYPLLKRLETRGAIAVLTDAEGEGSPHRKIYSITPQGQVLWRQKMLEYPHESWVNSRSRFLIKFLFFSYLEPAERLKLLQYRLMVCQLRLENREMQQPLSSDPYDAKLWVYCGTDLQREIQWLKEQLLYEQTTHTLVKDTSLQRVPTGE